MHLVLAYDVVDDSDRRRFFRRLKRFVVPVQRSVCCKRRHSRGHHRVDRMGRSALVRPVRAVTTGLRELLPRQFRAADAWRPGPAHRRPQPTSDGTVRWLTIPSPADRALQAAVLEVVAPRVEPRFDPHSHGFRRGRSVNTALDDLCAQVGSRQWLELVHLDIAAMFDSLDQARLLACVDEAWDDLLWRQLARRWIAAWPPTPGRGIPQGAPLSPLLANLFLDRHFDRPWRRVSAVAGCVGWIRHADDLALVTDRPGGTLRLLASVCGVLRACGLAIANHKVHRAQPRDLAPAIPVLGAWLRIARCGAGYEIARATVPAHPAGSGKAVVRP
jgi:hypothetical protein